MKTLLITIQRDKYNMEYVTKYKVVTVTSLLTIIGLIIDKLLGCGI